MLKDTNCGSPTKESIGKSVTLAGWVHRRRDHGGLIFIDLRDRSGIVQVTFNPESAPEAHQVAETLRNEWVVQVKGTVIARPKGTENANIPTGFVEIAATEAQVLNPAATPPFYINEESDVDELLRLKYRYLDLRKPHMRDNLILRHQIVKLIRDFLDERGFLEIETPILIKSTPEGARDYLVPSRLYKGQFYALPQSPQQLKQLLMVAGFEKYFQIARCFRDEDLRLDRQPEFTQLDLEMSFVDREDVVSLMEDLYLAVARKFAPDKRVPAPIPRLSYAQAMAEYGSDKPDIRFEMKLADMTTALKNTQFQIFRSVLDKGGVVKAIATPGMGEATRRQADELVTMAKGFGLGGLVTIGLSTVLPSLDQLAAEHIRSSAGRGLPLEEIKAIATQAKAKPGDMIFMAAGPDAVVTNALGQLRLYLGKKLGLADPNVLGFVFILDFPLLEWKPDEKRWDAVHHPFTSAKDEHWDMLETNPGAVQAKAYDLACNGMELAGGSIRIHRREYQERLFNVMGYTKEDAYQRFGQLLEAFEYGAPPHGGFAGGIERLAMILSPKADSIRDVMAFPKTQSAVDPLFGAPAPVNEAQLKDLHIRIAEE